MVTTKIKAFLVDVFDVLHYHRLYKITAYLYVPHKGHN